MVFQVYKGQTDTGMVKYPILTQMVFLESKFHTKKNLCTQPILVLYLNAVIKIPSFQKSFPDRPTVMPSIMINSVNVYWFAAFTGALLCLQSIILSLFYCLIKCPLVELNFMILHRISIYCPAISPSLAPEPSNIN